MKQQSGFTLVEIAIVLVIIGLLLGGVLKGQELITQAKIKNIVNDFNGLSAAIYGYQDRFRKLPGDDNQASARWAGAGNGNGNGVIGGEYNANGVPAGTEVDEAALFWQHLRLSGFVGGNASGALGAAMLPQNAVGGFLGVQTGAYGNPGLNICSANLTGKIASALDAQLDDGVPNAGQLRAAVAGLNASVPGAAVGNYVADDTQIYVVCKAL